MAWFDAEVPVLLTLIGYAEAQEFDTYAWQLPWALGPFFHRRGRLQAYAVIQQTALAAARRLDDTAGPRARASPTGPRPAADERLRGGRAELPAGAGPVPGTGRPGQRGGGAQRPGRHAGEAGALPGGAGRRAGRAADAQGRRALVDAGHAGERRRLALRSPGPVRRRADPLPAGAEPAPGIGPPRRRGRHPGQPGLSSTCTWATWPRPRPTTSRPSTPTARSARRSARATRWPGWATSCSAGATSTRPGRCYLQAAAILDSPAAPARRRSPRQAPRPGRGPGWDRLADEDHPDVPLPGAATTARSV